MTQTWSSRKFYGNSRNSIGYRVGALKIGYSSQLLPGGHERCRISCSFGATKTCKSYDMSDMSHAGGNWMKLASAISKIFRYISNYLNMWTLHFLTFFLHIFTWCLSTWALHALCVCSECALGWPHASLNLQDPGDDGLSISLAWHILSLFWRPKSLHKFGCLYLHIFMSGTFDIWCVPGTFTARAGCYVKHCSLPIQVRATSGLDAFE